MAIKFDDGSSNASASLDTVSAKNSGKNKIMFFRAPKEVDENGNKIEQKDQLYVLRLMNYSTDRRKQPFIRKFEHEAWRVNADGKREFAGRVTCVRSSYMQHELHLPHGAKAKDICPMCRYGDAKFLAAQNSGDRTLYKHAGDAEAKEHVYGVAYVLKDPNYKTNNGTLRVFRLDIPHVKKANRGLPIAYGICEELVANMARKGIDVMNPDGTSKNIYDLFCEVIRKEMDEGKSSNPKYCVFNGGFGVDLGISVKHIDLEKDSPYFGSRDMITNIRFSTKKPHTINEINPDASDEIRDNIIKMVNALDFDGNFMHVDTIDDIRDFCKEHYDLSASSADGFDDDDDDGEFVEPKAVKESNNEEVDDDEPAPQIKPTAAPKPTAKPAPKKVESKSFDEIMDDFDETEEEAPAAEKASSEPAPTGDTDIDDMPF